MIVIAIANSKGGTGKTTLAAALAVRAAKDSPRVGLVDLDPQQSLAEWWGRRGKTDNPAIFVGVDEAAEARERAELDGWDWVFLDGPPAHIRALQEMLGAADFALIPVRASTLDLPASEDAITLARDAGVPFLIVLNAVMPRERFAAKAREALAAVGVPVADAQIGHRAAHVAGMTVGKVGAEVNGGRDATAADEVDALWREVKSAAVKAARAKAKGGRR